MAWPLALGMALLLGISSTGGRRRPDGTYEDELPRSMQDAPAVWRTDATVNVSGKEKKEEEEDDCKRKVVLSRLKTPAAAKHIEDAQAAGYQKTLTSDRLGTNARRYQNTKTFSPISGMNIDEYPQAIFLESVGASVRYVPAWDNQLAGSIMGAQMNSPTRAREGCKVTIEIGD